MLRVVSLLLAALLLTGCDESEVSDADNKTIVRGLKTVLIKDEEQVTIRRYPSVLQPAKITTLSFETPGKLGPIDLKVGQQVTAGEKLAELDRRSLEIQVESAESALKQVQSSARNAAADFERQSALFKKGVTTNAQLDKARTSKETTAAQVDQAKTQLEAARVNLEKSALHAPFDGIVNSVEVESFANVAAGSPVATVYSIKDFESSFSVSYDVISRIAVGKKVLIRLADNPNISLEGVVSELGSRADTVSSFPIVVTLNGTRPELKAGMAVEISMDFAVPKGKGFKLPLTVLTKEGQIKQPKSANDPGDAFVFVFDPATSTVKRRKIRIGGIRENQIIAVEGLKLGERVASAGVSFLRDGQEVKLLADRH